MASSLNKVELIGRLGKDPEVKNLTNGSAVANFSVATSEVWKDKRSGEKQEKTEWHNIVVWNEKTIEFVEKYLAKGDLVRIEGKIQTRKWQDQDGKDRYSTEIVIPAFAPVEALMKLSYDNDNKSGGDRNDDRGSSRGGSSRGGNSRSNDDDDRGSSRGRGNNDDRGGDDRGSSSRGGGRGGNSRDNAKDDRGGGRGDDRGSSRGGGRNADMDDDIPF
ncbi:single-stranded DNA-binding protein [Bradyrhizobium ottawaense]|uniref:Single-stranded DNA-binding protein n=1 Tax=Bradyrhizobium ottawaense TaxID=931866 RepID=A0ABY0QHF9_9BRAD|nr:single-stranded DNA-binding protein [Bradyrhizobium ottawaense]SDK45312.1 single-strand binding protein [Bradyrhizobium ottawaense]